MSKATNEKPARPGARAKGSVSPARKSARATTREAAPKKSAPAKPAPGKAGKTSRTAARARAKRAGGVGSAGQEPAAGTPVRPEVEPAIVSERTRRASEGTAEPVAPLDPTHELPATAAALEAARARDDASATVHADGVHDDLDEGPVHAFDALDALDALDDAALRHSATSPHSVDDFGLSPTTHARLQPFLRWLYTSYFRVQVSGLEHIPAEGPALLVCNRGGALPWDGVMLAQAIASEHSAHRQVRWLVEDFAFHAPFIGPLLNRIGAVRACPENAERLLREGHVLAVFPEGIQGVGKSYKDRYRLQRFGRGGHVRLALRLSVPMIPVGIAGSDDTYPLLYKVRAFSKALGLPFIPVTPTFPWLGALGLAPLPSRFHIEVGPSLDGLAQLAPTAADDALAVHDFNDRVRRAVQQLLERALSERGPSAYR